MVFFPEAFFSFEYDFISGMSGGNVSQKKRAFRVSFQTEIKQWCFKSLYQSCTLPLTTSLSSRAVSTLLVVIFSKDYFVIIKQMCTWLKGPRPKRSEWNSMLCITLENNLCNRLFSCVISTHLSMPASICVRSPKYLKLMRRCWWCCCSCCFLFLFLFLGGMGRFWFVILF